MFFSGARWSLAKQLGEQGNVACLMLSLMVLISRAQPCASRIFLWRIACYHWPLSLVTQFWPLVVFFCPQSACFSGLVRGSCDSWRIGASHRELALVIIYHVSCFL